MKPGSASSAKSKWPEADAMAAGEETRRHILPLYVCLRVFDNSRRPFLLAKSTEFRGPVLLLWRRGLDHAPWSRRPYRRIGLDLYDLVFLPEFSSELLLESMPVLVGTLGITTSEN